MKKIEAIIKPWKVEEVKLAVESVGVAGMTITELRGFGRQRGHSELGLSSEYSVDFLPKVKLEIVVEEKSVDSVVTAIVRAARTGKIGDGKVFVLPVETSIRIRTDERGSHAI